MTRIKMFLSIISYLFIISATGAIAEAPTHTGVVLDSMTGGGYTYMMIEEGKKRFWIAGPQTSIASGTRVSFSEQVWMSNFESKALGRTFDRILFVNNVSVVSSVSAPPSAPPKASPSSGPASRAAGTYTVAEVFAKKHELKGKLISVRGDVVKVSKSIMRRMWVHIKDGTGAEGTDKLVFRSVNEAPAVGSVVIARGRVEVDKDFGFGYFYSVIIEDASFSK